MKEPKTSLWIVMLVGMVAVAIAVLDWVFPANPIAWQGLFIVPVVWIALWSAEDDVFVVTFMAAMVTFLMILPDYFAHELPPRKLAADRAIVIGTIWVTVVLALLRKRARRTYKWISLIGRR